VNICSRHQIAGDSLRDWCKKQAGSKGNQTVITAPTEIVKMIIETRTYKTTPGMRSRFLEIFHSKSIPAHREIGMKILGPFDSIEDPDTFFSCGAFLTRLRASL
jgi:hypothetical protein